MNSIEKEKAQDDLQQAMSAHGLVVRVKERLERKVAAVEDRLVFVEAHVEDSLRDISVQKRDLTKQKRKLDIDQVQLSNEKAVVALNVQQVAVKTKKMREERQGWRNDMLTLKRKRVKERKVCLVYFRHACTTFRFICVDS